MIYKIADIMGYQAIARFRQARDDYLIDANNSLVFYWSFFQSVLIMVCGLFEVYFIKKMFKVN